MKSEAAFCDDGGVGNGLRDGEAEGGEAVFEALGEDFAAVGFDDLFDDVQSEAGACFDRFQGGFVFVFVEDGVEDVFWQKSGKAADGEG